MSWFGKKAQDEEALAVDAQARTEALQAQIVEAMERQQWGTADEGTLHLIQHLRDTSELLPITQSALAELYARRGLILYRQLRYEEAQKELGHAEALFNMELESATRWAREEGITVLGEGDALDMDLALETLKVYAENLTRFGQPPARAALEQVVAVADLLEAPTEQWAAREQLATYLVSSAEWQPLPEVAREMGQLARDEGDLVRLLDVMRLFSEAYVGLQQLPDATSAQELVVEIARYLNHISLAEEEAELQRLRTLGS